MTWLVVGIVAAALIIVGWFAHQAYDVWWFRAHGTPVEGEVTQVDVRRRSDGETSWRSYTATVRFTTSDGTEIEAETPAHGSRPPEPGSTVQIHYDPANPSRARLLA